MEEKIITIQEKTVVNAGAATTMIYSCLCITFAANLLGFVGEGAGLAVGILQLGVFAGYIIGSMYVLKSGSDIGGNTFFLFATMFGGAGGLLTVSGHIFDYLGIPYCWEIGSIVNVVCGLILFVIAFANRINSKADFLVILFAAVGVSSAGLCGLVMPELFSLIGGIALGIDGIIAFYIVAAAYLEMSGIRINLGKPLAEKKKAENN